MKFPVYSDDELNEMQSFKLMPNGDYDFQVIEAKDTHSKKGNPMIELKIKVWDSDGREYLIFDYLLEQFAWKIKHFCQSTGLEHKWESGDLNADDCLGKCGIADIYTQKSKDPQYSDKNAVKNYLPADVSRRTQETVKKPEAEKDEFEDDSIPF